MDSEAERRDRPRRPCCTQNCPRRIDQFTLLHLVGDLVGVLDALGAERAVIVATHSRRVRSDHPSRRGAYFGGLGLVPVTSAVAGKAGPHQKRQPRRRLLTPMKPSASSLCA
jgi:hypothetical protein